MNQKVLLHTSLGDITIELNEELAPKTVANFLKYVKNGHYNNTIFHRIIDDFMVQGGGFTPDMIEKKSENPIKNEANNGLKNNFGTIAMARTMNPHSATAQFFINVADNDFLNFRAETQEGWGYAVFGQVIAGDAVLNKMKKVATTSQNGHENVPATEVILNGIEML